LRFATPSLTLALIISGGSFAWTFAVAQAPSTGRDSGAMQMHIYAVADLQWKDGPGVLPAGAKFAVLEGDPSKEGLFTMRLQLPNGYQIPPHYHSGVEHVTVISGTLNVGMGEKFDKSATKRMPAGTFGYWPPAMRHFAWTDGETTLQLHGIGPWTVTYVNPADDPRKK
jgi:quercetin dioxygenase-like cupin family protein